jgi:hypothetical protein
VKGLFFERLGNGLLVGEGYQAFDCAGTAVGWVTGRLGATGVFPESLLDERFIKGLREGPLNIGFFEALDWSAAGTLVEAEGWDVKLGVYTLG